jgi:hypothetical protein
VLLPDPIPPIIPIIGFLLITKSKLNQRKTNNQSNISKSFLPKGPEKSLLPTQGKMDYRLCEKLVFGPLWALAKPDLYRIFYM